jgi:hypothetical protein
MSRNIDVIAMALLLAGFAIYTSARSCVLTALNAHRIGFTNYTHTMVIPPAPPAPAIPPAVRFMRD